ncbi:hypothetical protein HCQ94_03390 [Actinomyces sp. zg-332]|uniref:DUF6892 domain-containing protein n=1 Tax=Actinomyces sp. zg-332 TaxID=2708340 RepID=UPI0018E084BC|nr:hypothetical protein [Actinomyces sp. zg-332]QPK93651.1 hypothetical protein HCQ94_03390 [Actinomyces sp. zg-332]
MKFFDRIFRRSSYTENTISEHEFEEKVLGNQNQLWNYFPMKDKSNMFEDCRFKLVVIEEILDKNPSFLSNLDILDKKYADYDFYDSGTDYISDYWEFFENLELTEEDLLKVQTLVFDGGLEIYHKICPDWDGEDDMFLVTSISGYEKLSILKEVHYISNCDEYILQPLKQSPNINFR